ncbi:DUF1080 domain-containing protein [Mucilaginibacter hurinus]|uniref:DUF1080 domain-containing protein n=1 Tax=Mucilaginibacter hurinus TaxID=2201324 RepID=A0A367GMA1_9SPHI|nr:DUF1080 domain-containing protein [Mucilaginibacter hurinus]RCH54165.1 DUF1080 domain-containing protein [Mucilaginibacter hurinus]
MKVITLALLAGAVLLGSFTNPVPSKKPIRLFNGKNFSGWEGDTINTWRIKNGEIIGGSLTQTVPHNEFIATTKNYGNFILKVKVKLLGNEGFINTGVQFNSQRIANPPYEMKGYQADLGDGFWGCLYDEARRNKILIKPDSNLVERIVKRGQWNDYEVWSENGRIRIKLNGVQTIDYTEPDGTIPQTGLIAFQIHGYGKAEVHYKDIYLTQLPAKN